MKILNRRGETFLPDEIMEQILWKLPAKSVLRFKSVHKRWLYLISRPNFSQWQLKHVLSLDDEKKIMVLSSDGSKFYVLNQHGKTVHHKYNLPSALSAASAPEDSVRLLGSCNGLLCIGIFSNFDRSGKLDNWDVPFNPIIWNPVLNDYKKVPFSVSNMMEWFGFGYDFHTQDFKLVKVRWTLGSYAEVYSLKSCSKTIFPFQVCDKNSSMSITCWVGSFFNGSLYWLGFTSRYDATAGSYIEKPCFLVFDLRYEKFRVVEFPNYTLPKQGGHFPVVVRDCNWLGACFYDHEYINLVTMKEDEAENSCWNLIRISQPEGNLISYPICFMNVEEILVRVNNNIQQPRNPNNNVFIYNPQRRTIELAATEIHRSVHCCGSESQFTTYIQTLVSPSNL